ncbi:10 kDa chaperonin [Streptomyces nitrosporeus]|nr:10 kDa chaperonin [Streptomyces nitrosporeus]
MALGRAGGAGAGRFRGVSENTDDKLPIRMLHDRVLVRSDSPEGERRSGGGILIPATAAVGRRLAWAAVVAVGQNVRTVEPGDRVLYDPEDRAEVEVRGVAYVLMRERDLHAVAADRFEGAVDSTGLYL